MNVFRRDGHLHDLAIEAILDGEIDPQSEEHITSCDLCLSRVDAARAYGEGVDLPPLQSQPQPVALRPANRSSRFGARLYAPLLIALAAAVLLVAWVGRPDPVEGDGITLRGSGLGLRVYRDEGGNSRRLRDGDLIAPGDRLGFSVQNREPGHLMIIGVDSGDESYLCYPQRGGGRSEPVDASSAPRDLDEAIRMDDIPGEERIVAVLCAEPFDFEDLSEAVREGEPPQGCVFSDVTVRKP